MIIVQLHKPGCPDLAPYKSMFDENNIEFVQYPEFLSEEEQLKYCEGADAIATSILKFPREVIEKLPDSVKCIVRTAMGYEIVDVEACSERGILVCNVPDYAMEEVAMHQVALIMALCRKLKHYDLFVHSGGWTRQSMIHGYECRRISSLTIGLLGLGRIAKNVAKAMLAMGATVCTYDPYLSRETVEALGVKFCETKDELLAQSDVISANIPLTDESFHIIDEDAVSKMKDGVIVVNTGRGALVDTNALVAGLQSGKIKAAGLDVHETEPFSDVNHPLMKMENVILTNHVAFQSTEAAKELEYKSALYAMQGAKGEVPASAVNKQCRK